MTLYIIKSRLFRFAMEQYGLSLLDPLCNYLDTKGSALLTQCSKNIKAIVDDRVDAILCRDFETELVKFARYFDNKTNVDHVRRLYWATTSYEVDVIARVMTNDRVFVDPDIQDLFIAVCFNIKNWTDDDCTLPSLVDKALLTVITKLLGEFQRLKETYVQSKVITSYALVAKLFTKIIKWMGHNGIDPCLYRMDVMMNKEFLTKAMEKLSHFHSHCNDDSKLASIFTTAMTHVGALKYCLMNEVVLYIGTKGGFYYYHGKKKRYLTQRHILNLYY